MIERTYEATLYAPLFYSSSEGRAIRTQPTLSAIALMHALGYRYFGLEKQYVHTGDDATEPGYGHLTELPFFASDMRPISVQADERTFRSVDYLAEWTLRTDESELAKRAIGERTVPPSIKKFSGAGHQPQRHYIGIAPGSTYEFTIWIRDDEQEQDQDRNQDQVRAQDDAPTLPDRPFFRMGIKQTGELRAQERDTVGDPEPVTLNTYLLSEVYGLSDALIAELIERSTSYERGSHYTLHHAVGVPPAFVRDRIVPNVLGTREGS